MANKKLQIELLYFDACPSWRKAHEILSETLKAFGLSQDIRLVRVETQEQAVQNKFTGSPMIRVNGQDLFPTGQENFALGCRVYQTPEGYRGWPTTEMLQNKLSQWIE